MTPQIAPTPESLAVAKQLIAKKFSGKKKLTKGDQEELIAEALEDWYAWASVVFNQALQDLGLER